MIVCSESAVRIEALSIPLDVCGYADVADLLRNLDRILPARVGSTLRQRTVGNVFSPERKDSRWRTPGPS